MTTSVENEVAQIHKVGEQIKNDARRCFGPGEWERGDTSAQGDVMFINIGVLPASARPRKNRQLADGNTLGSRHIVTRGDVFECDPSEVANLALAATGQRIPVKYIGPVFTGPALVEHPEHGDQEFTGECVNATVYQRVWDAEQQQERRAVD